MKIRKQKEPVFLPGYKPEMKSVTEIEITFAELYELEKCINITSPNSAARYEQLREAILSTLIKEAKEF
jgi:hypothetical protein